MIFRKIDIKKFLVILLGSSILGVLYNSLSPNGLAFIYEEKQYISLSDNNRNMITNNNAPLLITHDQALTFFTDGVRFIDARDGWDFAEGHIPGALNIPEYKFTPNDSIANSLSKSEKYVIYCGGDDCDTSKRLSEELLKLGFKELYIYLDGFIKWQESDLPVEK